MTTPDPSLEALKPCPFCGSDAAVIIESSQQQFKVFCDHGSCSVMTSIWGGRRPAIAAWNRRTQSSELERLKAVQVAAQKLQGFRDCQEAQRLDKELPEEHGEVDESCNDGICFKVGGIIDEVLKALDAFKKAQEK